MREEITSAAQRVGASIPPAYLLAWFVGVRWDLVAGFLACVWTLGLMWQSWLWKPLVKPWLARRRARG